MALPFWCADEITIVRAPLVATRGTATERDWTAATEHIVTGCSVQVGATASDLSEARVGNVTTDALLFAPLGSDIEKGDRVVYDGSTWTVDGNPANRKSPFGSLDHMRVQLSLWEG